MKVADAIWIAAALLSREHPERLDFSLAEIVNRAEAERLTDRPRATLYAHVTQHCVGNTKPSTGRYRMLFETRKGHRRLFGRGDIAHRRREGSKVAPAREDLPQKYRPLLDWYEAKYSPSHDNRTRVKNDPILALRGLGKEIWKGVDPDEYVRQLREEWE